MQPPKTTDDLLTLLEKSKLVEGSRLSQLREKLSASPTPPADPPRLADALVKQHVISRFQADQLLQGRSKGFWVKRYKIIEQVGIGGMARVFLAEHAIMRRKVALKVLPTSKCADPASLARFLREARAIASINHPNVIRAYDIDQDADFYFIVLEFAEGLTVAQYVEAHGAIPWPQACDYLYQSAAGLEHLLGCGLIHRDIKPSNLIIDHTGTIKVVDLGLAVFFEEKELDPLTLKYDQNVLGTADYLAPEQALDSHNVDGRADIYSLGATFCFMLSGQPPFPNGTIAEKLHAHQTEPFTSIRDRAPDVPKDLDNILKKMLAKKPEDRFHSMTELRSALRRFLPNNSVAAQLSGTFTLLNGHASSHRKSTDSDPAGVPLATPLPTTTTPKSDIRHATPQAVPPRPSNPTPTPPAPIAAPAVKITPAKPPALKVTDDEATEEELMEEEVETKNNRRQWLLLGTAVGALSLAAGFLAYVYLL